MFAREGVTRCDFRIDNLQPLALQEEFQVRTQIFQVVYDIYLDLRGFWLRAVTGDAGTDLKGAESEIVWNLFRRAVELLHQHSQATPDYHLKLLLDVLPDRWVHYLILAFREACLKGVTRDHLAYPTRAKPEACGEFVLPQMRLRNDEVHQRIVRVGELLDAAGGTGRPPFYSGLFGGGGNLLRFL